MPEKHRENHHIEKEERRFGRAFWDKEGEPSCAKESVSRQRNLLKKGGSLMRNRTLPFSRILALMSKPKDKSVKSE